MPTSTVVETRPDTATSRHAQGDSSTQSANSAPGGVSANGSNPDPGEPPVLCNRHTGSSSAR
jgi:hypothetical protein